MVTQVSWTGRDLPVVAWYAHTFLLCVCSFHGGLGFPYMALLIVKSLYVFFRKFRRRIFLSPTQIGATPVAATKN
jgi:hypothetical protein